MRRIYLFLTTALLALSGCSAMPSEESIGIIGGADGPTAIFVTRRALGGWEIALGIGLAALLLTAVILLILRRRK